MSAACWTLLLGGVALLSHHDDPQKTARKDPSAWLDHWRETTMGGAMRAGMKRGEGEFYTMSTAPGLLLEWFSVEDVARLSTNGAEAEWKRAAASNALTLVIQGPPRRNLP